MWDIGSLVGTFFSTLGDILGQFPVVGETLSGIVGQVAATVASLLSAIGLG